MTYPLYDYGRNIDADSGRLRAAIEEKSEKLERYCSSG